MLSINNSLVSVVCRTCRIETVLDPVLVTREQQYVCCSESAVCDSLRRSRYVLVISTHLLLFEIKHDKMG
ncbi:hypothetical protein C0J50_18046 [Silurus asotus]|uniref:Uncharacterized protein n=1 Tax=Silurus asotus TaxID=30991 RepID=A0AAD5AUT7_SILAS|nr:hypothetical protein C0J50_18046 [Silurus asotus]